MNMKMSVLIKPAQLAITCTLMLAACLLGQDRGGTPTGDGRILIGGVFSKAHASGSLEYRGVCNFKEPYPDFPKLRPTSGHEGSAVESLREMFSVDPEMRVSQDADGKIRMIEVDVPSDLLDVRIHHLRFPAEYHGPNVAKNVILQSPEVISFRREHNIGPEADWGHGFALSSDAFAPSKPSVSGDLSDVTVRQALDYVLRVFPGFWVYENCKSRGGDRVVYIAFFENAPHAVPAQTQK
jgi:hypothetical protein